MVAHLAQSVFGFALFHGKILVVCRIPGAGVGNPTPEPTPEPEPTTPTDAELFTAAGLDINNYEVFDWAPEVGAFYNCKNSYAVLNSSNSTASNLVNFIASGYITLEDLPVGSVIIVDEGYAK